MHIYIHICTYIVYVYIYNIYITFIRRHLGGFLSCKKGHFFSQANSVATTASSREAIRRPIPTDRLVYSYH